MEGWNIADILGIVFLGFGIVDGYRKGLVKKGMSLVFSLVSLFAVYLAAPFVETLIAGLLPSSVLMNGLADTDSEIWRILMLSGLGTEAEKYVSALAVRILSVVVTYIFVKIFLRTLFMSMNLLMKVPGLSLLNRLLGASVGLVQHLLALWIFLLAVFVFSGTSLGAFLLGAIKDSAWLSVLYENNPLLILGILLVTWADI